MKMQTMILSLLLVASVSALSQPNPKPQKPATDTVSAKPDSITGKTIFYITLEDIDRYMDKLKDKTTARQYDYILQGVRLIISEMINEKKNNQFKIEGAKGSKNK